MNSGKFSTEISSKISAKSRWSTKICPISRVLSILKRQLLAYQCIGTMEDFI